MYQEIEHEAVYKVHPEAVTFSDVYGAFDVNNNSIKLDILKIEEESKKIKQEKKIENIKYQRSLAYLKESDPLFFKIQRGESNLEEWKSKIQEIRDRFPYPTT